MSKQEKKDLIPVLRFPEFQNAGEWEESQLGERDISNFVKERASLKQLKLEDYVSTENLLPDYAGITIASKLPPTGCFAQFKKGDILISNIRPYLKKVWFASKDGASSNDVIVIQAQSKISNLFLSFLLKNDKFINYVMRSAKGVKMPRGDISLIKEYPIAFPITKEEQQKIADCLSSIDNLITAQGQKLDTLKEHKKALMQQLFPAEGETVPRMRFLEFRGAEEWKFKLLSDICDVKGGKRIPKGYRLTIEKTGFPYIRVSDMYMGGVNVSSVLYISEEVENSIRNYKISKNDLFITVAGTIGIIGRIPGVLDNANLTENANKIIIKNVVKEYLLQYLCSDCLQKIITSSITNNAQPKLALERIRNFSIPLPSPEEQQKIANCLSSIDELITAQAQTLEALKDHKKGLMQQLFPAIDEEAG